MSENKTTTQVEEVTPEAPRWIPVGERMPPNDPQDPTNSVLVAIVNKWGEVYAARFVTLAAGWYDAEGVIGQVTHWMALPQPPKGGA